LVSLSLPLRSLLTLFSLSSLFHVFQWFGHGPRAFSDFPARHAMLLDGEAGLIAFSLFGSCLSSFVFASLFFLFFTFLSAFVVFEGNPIAFTVTWVDSLNSVCTSFPGIVDLVPFSVLVTFGAHFV
jgi:hypothetical protein